MSLKEELFARLRGAVLSGDPEEVGPGGLFLKYKHTREWWIKEHYIPKLLNRKTYDMWKKSGAKDLVTVAREQVEKILREHVVEPLPPDIERELDKTMLEIAKKYGIEKLPPLPQA
jgi:trimethylamine--corrinoid protein Co-methyltransferase